MSYLFTISIVQLDHLFHQCVKFLKVKLIAAMYTCNVMAVLTK